MITSKFISNSDCPYFPCHKVEDEKEFNCLFCYCPLYALGSKCGGDYVYLENGTKDCSKCRIPHEEGGYEFVLSKADEVIELAKINK